MVLTSYIGVSIGLRVLAHPAYTWLLRIANFLFLCFRYSLSPRGLLLTPTLREFFCPCSHGVCYRDLHSQAKWFSFLHAERLDWS